MELAKNIEQQKNGKIKATENGRVLKFCCLHFSTRNLLEKRHFFHWNSYFFFSSAIYFLLEMIVFTQFAFDHPAEGTEKLTLPTD